MKTPLILLALIMVASCASAHPAHRTMTHRQKAAIPPLAERAALYDQVQEYNDFLSRADAYSRLVDHYNKVIASNDQLRHPSYGGYSGIFDSHGRQSEYIDSSLIGRAMPGIGNSGVLHGNPNDDQTQLILDRNEQLQTAQTLLAKIKANPIYRRYFAETDKLVYIGSNDSWITDKSLENLKYLRHK